MEPPDELLARLKLGREEYCQRLLTSLILGAPYPRWNSRNVPCERGYRFLELLEEISFGEALCIRPYLFVDELDLGRRPQDLKASAPDWAVFTDDRLWVIELKTERGSHRAAQVPTYVATARHHYPHLAVDLTYVTGPMPPFAPDLPDGTRYAHLTWDAVVPIVEQVWDDGTAGLRAAVARIGEVVAGLGTPWSEWREAKLGLRKQEGVPMTTIDSPSDSGQGEDPVDQAVELARLTAADHEQRAVDFVAGSLERLREVGLAIREALYEDGDEGLSHVLPWLWNVETSTGKALTAGGAEVGYELRLSWYDEPVGRSTRSSRATSPDRPSAALCPVHFIELPTSGVCDLCE